MQNFNIQLGLLALYESNLREKSTRPGYKYQRIWRIDIRSARAWAGLALVHVGRKLIPGAEDAKIPTPSEMDDTLSGSDAPPLNAPS